MLSIGAKINKKHVSHKRFRFFICFLRRSGYLIYRILSNRMRFIKKVLDDAHIKVHFQRICRQGNPRTWHSDWHGSTNREHPIPYTCMMTTWVSCYSDDGKPRFKTPYLLFWVAALTHGRGICFYKRNSCCHIPIKTKTTRTFEHRWEAWRVLVLQRYE